MRHPETIRWSQRTRSSDTEGTEQGGMPGRFDSPLSSSVSSGSGSVNSVARIGHNLLLGVGLLLLAGCGNMKKQNYLRPESPSIHLPRSTSAQLPPAHTVAHRAKLPDAVFETGEKNGRLVTELPMPVTRDLLARGQERFNIYCAVCHGPDGYGHGIIVQRGFPAPPSYHEPRLLNAPVGHFFQVMTHGYGAMYPYADRLAAADRWAVAAYIRALQLSQRTSAQALSDAERNQLARR